MSTDELESTISAALAEQTGLAPPNITCPEPLPAAAGSTVRCTLSDGDVTIGVTVTATGAQGGTVQFDFRVDDVPTSDLPR